MMQCSSRSFVELADGVTNTYQVDEEEKENLETFKTTVEDLCRTKFDSFFVGRRDTYNNWPLAAKSSYEIFRFVANFMELSLL